MKFKRIYMVGGENGKADPTDYVVGYKAENGKRIEIMSLLNTPGRWYEVNGRHYFTLKDAKAACIG